MNRIVSNITLSGPQRDELEGGVVSKLCLYNSELLKQMFCVIELSQPKIPAAMNYAQTVGPHLRHVIEHYCALFNGLAHHDFCVNYDVRERNLAIQSIPDITLSKIQELVSLFEILAAQKTLRSDQPLKTCFKSGLAGEQAFKVESSLARELLFLASHTVHHFAIIRLYCTDAGIKLRDDFGKAPSTIAFERSQHG